jgi:hypothetical protein
MKALRAEGVDTIEALVEQMISSRHSRSRPRVAVNEKLFARQDSRQSGLKGLTHQPPQVPLHVDGVLVDPSDIVQFNGQPLHYVLTRASGAGECELHAFDRPRFGGPV